MIFAWQIQAKSRGSAVKQRILSFLLLFASLSSHAQYQSLDVLKSMIEQHMTNELSANTDGIVRVSADKLDSRLTLQQCPTDKLTIFNPYQTPLLNTNTMGIKCIEEQSHWTLYVPVHVTVLKTVLVAKRALIKGSRITDEDLQQVEMDAQRLKQGYFTDKQQLVGLISKQNISPNSPLSPYNIELAKLIHKGEQVAIIATDNHLTISMDGIALNEGVLGDLIKVKNKSSHKIVEAQVSGKKQVKITL